jgi:hypothetical protein
MILGSFAGVKHLRAAPAAWNFTRMAPTEGPWGTRVRLFGYGFTTEAKVFYDGQLIKAVSISPTAIVADVPDGSRSGWFEIAQGGQQLRAPETFRVKNEPQVTDLDPKSGPPGLWITVTGKHLTEDMRFWIGRSPVRKQFVSPKSLKLLIHAGLASGQLSFAVDQSRKQTKLRFDIAQYPVLSGFKPRKAFVGDRVTLEGLSFCPGAAVFLGGVSLPVTRRERDKVLVVTLPAGVATGRLEIECFGKRVSHGDELLVEPPYSEVQGISPTGGKGGTWIKVIGIGFTRKDQFKLGNVPLRMRFQSPTIVEVFIPARAQEAPIYHESFGRWFKSSFTYTIYQPPVITSFAPRSAWHGNFVTLTGRHFCPMAKVRLGQQELQIVQREGSTSLTVQIPQGARSERFSVQCLDWTAASPGRLILEAPKAGVNDVQPTLAPPGGRIVITGFNLRPSDRFYLGTMPLPMAFESAQKVSVTLPPRAKDDVLVHESFGRKVQTRFRIRVGFPAPVFSGFEPKVSWFGEVVTLRGEQICEAPIVRLGKKVVPVVNSSGTTIQITVPRQTQGGRFEVQCHNHVVEVPGKLTLEAPFAQITSIFPARGPWGTWITLTGRGFTDQDRFFIGPKPVEDVRRMSAVEVRVKVPRGAESGRIVVMSRGRRTVTDHRFTLALPEPQVESLTPSEGWYGDYVVIEGRHFCPSPVVRFGAKPALDFVRESESRIKVRVPAGVYTGSVEVRCYGKAGRFAGSFKIVKPQPRIVDVNPERGPPKRWINISGQNLDRVEKAWLNHRQHGRVELVLKKVSATRLQAFVPEGCKGGAIEFQAYGARTTTSFAYLVPRDQR